MSRLALPRFGLTSCSPHTPHGGNASGPAKPVPRHSWKGQPCALRNRAGQPRTCLRGTEGTPTALEMIAIARIGSRGTEVAQ